MEKSKIDCIFLNIFDDIDNIIKSDFYDKKGEITKIRNIIEKWYNEYKQSKTLVQISINELEYLDLEITEIFDMYIKDESIKENYCERLSYDFGILENKWKEEMLGGK